MANTRKIALHYLHHATWSALPADDRELLELAVKAARHAYAPYSKFKVGAALRLESGEIVPGSNQENASFPAGICAERTALHAAMAVVPKGTVESIAVVVPQLKGSRPVTPCGICRQALVEQERRQGGPMRLLLGVVKGPVIETFSAETLLPLSFDSSQLGRKPR
ncbi:MAG: cytidine deaminase [Flavobacteriales bacterium]|nr:cytidine deaminase [Flavobacteriales bacterium]MBP9079981.1 cytidine deaminase [Flavobacteriales bacterium]